MVVPGWPATGGVGVGLQGPIRGIAAALRCLALLSEGQRFLSRTRVEKTVTGERSATSQTATVTIVIRTVRTSSGTWTGKLAASRYSSPKLRPHKRGGPPGAR